MGRKESNQTKKLSIFGIPLPNLQWDLNVTVQ